MSGLFCNNSYLCTLERQMQQPPGYRPRGHGLWSVEGSRGNVTGNYLELVDYVIDRIQMEYLKERAHEIFHLEDKEMIFRDMNHRKDFYSLILGSRGRTLWEYPDYGAAVFLLSADRGLWELVYKHVSDTGICFGRVRLGSVALEQYILFHASKDMYYGTKHIHMAELTDRELISDTMFRLIMNAFVIREYGVEIMKQEVQG